MAHNLSEQLAKLVPQAKSVAALPPFAEALQAAKLPEPTPSVFVCGGDDAARATVMDLVADLGANGVDAGPLYAARYFKPMMMGLVHLAYARKLGSSVGMHLTIAAEGVHA